MSIKKSLAGNLVERWDFREGKINGKEGTSTTSSPASVLWQKSPKGNYLKFSGSEALTLSAVDPYKLDNFTMMIWAKPDQIVPSVKPLFSMGAGQFYFGLTASNAVIFSSNDATSTQVTFSSTVIPVKTGEWSLIGVTVERIGDVVTTVLYVNGNLSALKSRQTGWGSTYGSIAIIGGFTASNFFFNGGIREIYQYDKPFTSKEMADFYSESLQEACVLGMPKENFKMETLYGTEDDLGSEVLTDGDMEASGTSAWTAGNSATLTKDTTNPYSGNQCLKVAYNGATNAYASQTSLTVGKTYKLEGRARSDGTQKADIWNGGTQLWTSSASTDWQKVEIYFTAGYTKLDLYCIGTAGYTEFDSLSTKETHNVGAWNMIINDDIITDNSPDLNDLTATNGAISQVYEGGVPTTKFDGSSSYLSKVKSNYRIGDTEGSMEGVVLCTDSISINTIFCSSDNSALLHYLMFYLSSGGNSLVMQTNDGSGGSYTTSIRGNTNIPLNQLVYFRVTTDGSKWKLFLNNTEDTPYAIGNENSGNWFADVLLRDSLQIGSLKRTTPAYFFNGGIVGLKIDSKIQSDVEYEKRYLKFAKTPLYINDFEDVPITLQTSTDELGGYTPFTGAHKIALDSNDKKCLTNVTSGIVYRDSSQAYGTWIFKVNKYGGSNTIHIGFIASEIGGAVATGQDGYTLSFNSLEALSILRTSAGIATTLMSSDVDYLKLKTDYEIMVTRSPAHKFTLYVKGDDFTDWTLVDTTGGSGTNPVINTTVQSSNYSIIDDDTYDTVKSIKCYQGDLTPNQLS